MTPEEELINLGKPVFMEWLNKQGNNKWLFVWQWIQSRPIIKIFHSVTEFLNAPQNLEHLKEIEQKRQFQFTIYENHKKQLFLLTLLGLTGVGVGIYSSHPLILKLSVAVSAISILGYLICNNKLKNG